MQVYITLDSDPTKKIELEVNKDTSSIADLLSACKTGFFMNEMNIDHYGFKTQTENILLRDIAQIDKSRDPAVPGRDDFLYQDIGFDLELTT